MYILKTGHLTPGVPVPIILNNPLLKVEKGRRRVTTFGKAGLKFYVQAGINLEAQKMLIVQ